MQQLKLGSDKILSTLEFWENYPQFPESPALDSQDISVLSRPNFRPCNPSTVNFVPSTDNSSTVAAAAAKLNNRSCFNSSQ